VAVPIGSLLSVIAVTVTANAPATAEGAAVNVRTARPPMMVVLGENDAASAISPLETAARQNPARPLSSAIPRGGRSAARRVRWS